MNENEVKVGQVFKDGDHRIANPYIRVDRVHRTKSTAVAIVSRFADIDCKASKSGRAVNVKIMLSRLIKTGARGYSLVRSPEAVQPAAPEVEIVAASAPHDIVLPENKVAA